MLDIDELRREKECKTRSLIVKPEWEEKLKKRDTFKYGNTVIDFENSILEIEHMKTQLDLPEAVILSLLIDNFENTINIKYITENLYCEVTEIGLKRARLICTTINNKLRIVDSNLEIISNKEQCMYSLRKFNTN